MEPCNDLPAASHPELHHNNCTLGITPDKHLGNLFGYVDADWATDTKNHKSVTGVILMYAGGEVG